MIENLDVEDYHEMKMVIPVDIVYAGLEGFAALAEFFGIPEHDAERLFSESRTRAEDKKDTPKTVAKRIRQYVKNVKAVIAA